MERKRVFVTGIGIVSSIGVNKAEVLDSLKSLRHGFSSYPPFENDPKATVKLVGNVDGFDVESNDFEDWTYPKEYSIKREVMRGFPPHGVYVYCAMMQAIADAALQDGDVSDPGVGITTASGGSPMLTYTNMTRMRKYGPMRCPPMSIVAAIAGTLSFNLVAAFQIQGNSCGFSSACASSAHAMGYAYDDIALGRQKRMFVATGEDLNYESVVPFTGMRALSLEGVPERASCPFDAKRNGFVSTGGGAVLVLESEDEVERRGSNPYCEMLGWGQASDGYNVAISHPEGDGLKRSMQAALDLNGLEPGAIDYVNAHATSTLIGDASEGKALKEVFSDRGCSPKVSSTKALTGHGLSLAGAMEASFVGLSMREGFTPGSAHIQNLDPLFEPLNVIRETEPVAPQIAMSNSSGFGGANVSLLFKKT